MNRLAASDDLGFDLALIYIAEAHAEDEWPIGSEIKINQHCNVTERAAAAQACLQGTGLKNWPFYVDSNQFEQQYAPWPIRFYVYRKRDVGGLSDIYCDWISEPSHGGYYDWPELVRMLYSFV